MRMRRRSREWSMCATAQPNRRRVTLYDRLCGCALPKAQSERQLLVLRADIRQFIISLTATTAHHTLNANRCVYWPTSASKPMKGHYDTPDVLPKEHLHRSSLEHMPALGGHLPQNAARRFGDGDGKAAGRRAVKMGHRDGGHGRATADRADRVTVCRTSVRGIASVQACTATMAVSFQYTAGHDAQTSPHPSPSLQTAGPSYRLPASNSLIAPLRYFACGVLVMLVTKKGKSYTHVLYIHTYIHS
ncbi:hypothetical protein SKAU_G00072910 [Synaphobranchus kaupii]|uniref:Uncharacterized protein n=1 Tax=Synaphobranchus kaupii TaxID=118154 RepID=A0A9Q1JAP2_SYNKA|nr:hypothetical protein SKAU_G00072910 [Synaphobranchus kaupii]